MEWCSDSHNIDELWHKQSKNSQIEKAISISEMTRAGKSRVHFSVPAGWEEVGDGRITNGCEVPFWNLDNYTPLNQSDHKKCVPLYTLFMKERKASTAHLCILKVFHVTSEKYLTFLILIYNSKDIWIVCRNSL